MTVIVPAILPCTWFRLLGIQETTMSCADSPTTVADANGAELTAGGVVSHLKKLAGSTIFHDFTPRERKAIKVDIALSTMFLVRKRSIPQTMA